MQRNRRLRVVILYSHALLGEGVAKLLSAEPGLDVALVPTQDVEAARDALSADPHVVIYERSQPLQEIDLLNAAPEALLIDASMDAGRHPAVGPSRSGPEEILRALRHMRRTGRRPAEGAVAHAP